VRLVGLGKLKKKINDLIGNRTRDLSTCSIVHRKMEYCGKKALAEV
jgi:hypothetical protein